MKFTHKKDLFNFPELIAETSEKGRLYKTPHGGKYPSITTVLGARPNEGLQRWRATVGEDKAKQIMSQAATRGTALHEMVERYCDNQPDYTLPDETDNVKGMFEAIKPYLDRIDNIIGQEVPLYSDTLRVAGRVDMIAEYDGVLSIIDFKSASKIKRKEWIDNYFMQAAGYAAMLEEQTLLPVRQVVIIMAAEKDFGAAVFVDRARPWISPLVQAIKYYNDHREKAD